MEVRNWSRFVVAVVRRVVWEVLATECHSLLGEAKELFRALERRPGMVRSSSRRRMQEHMRRFKIWFMDVAATDSHHIWGTSAANFSGI